MAARTYYEILDVEPTATPKEIARARRRLSDMNHPDKVAHLAPKFKELAEEETKEINAAYDVLKDPRKRADYDGELADQRRAEEDQQQAEEAQRRREAEGQAAEERRRREEESRRRDNQQQSEEQRRREKERRQRENQQRAEEARRRREAEESPQRENRHYGAQPNYPPGSVAQTTGTNSGLWLTLSIIMVVISPLTTFIVSAPFGMLFGYLAMRSGRRTGGMVMLVINGAQLALALTVLAILLFLS